MVEPGSGAPRRSRERAGADTLRIDEAEDGGLSALFDAFPEPAFIVGEDRRIHLANHAAESVFGFLADGLDELGVEVLVAESDVRRCLSFFAEMFGPDAPRRSVAQDLACRRHDGSGFPAEIVITRIEAGTGRQVLVTIRDRSHERETEAALNENYELRKAQDRAEYQTALWRSQQEAAIDGILIVDHDGDVVSFNQRFLRMWGLPDDVIKVGESDEGALGAVLEQVEDPDAFIAGIEKLHTYREMRSRDEVRFKDGRVFERWSAPVLGAHGAYYGRGWYFRDITDRVRASVELQRARDELAAILSRVGDGIIVCDADRRVSYANKAAAALFGVDGVDALHGVPGDELAARIGLRHDEEDADDRRPLPSEEAWTGRVPVARFVRWTRNGETMHGVLKAAPVHDASGEVAFVVQVLVDVTSLREAQTRLEAAYTELKEHERFRLQFLNNVSHDLATPLTPIKIQMHLLENERHGALSEGQRRAVDILSRNLTQLDMLIKDLKDVARLEAGRLRFDVETFDLSDTVRAAVESFIEPARQAGVELDLDLVEPCPVHADPARVTQVLFNLLTNAVKFTKRPDHTAGRIHVSLATEGGHAVVRVADDGIGIDPARIPHLFRPFAQVHDATVDVRGTGLGLYISRSILERLGGTIEAASDGLGCGTTITMKLPRFLKKTHQGPGSRANTDQRQ